MTAEEHFNKILFEIPDAVAGKMFGANAIKMQNGCLLYTSRCV